MTQYVLTGRPGGEPGLSYPFSLITDQMGVGSTQDFTLSTQDEATLIAAGIVQPVSSEVTGFATLDVAGRLTGGQVPVSVATVSSPGGAAASTPAVWLDSYYDAAVFASKTAAVQAAYAAAAAGHATLECQAARVYLLDTGALALAPSTPITINGHGAIFKSTWGRPRVIDFVRAADGDTFLDITINDLGFDANGATAVSNQSLVGNMIDGGGSRAQRINATRITLKRCWSQNVPRGAPGTVSYQSFSLNSNHLASNETTQTSLTHISLEDCDWRGGNVGTLISGTCAGVGATVTPGLGVNVWLDDINLTRVRHDSLTVPTATGFDASVQIAGYGYGDRCSLTDCYGANSADVIYEIDNMQNPVMTRCEAVDAWNCKFLYRNFRAPLALASQKMIWQSCISRTVNLARKPGTGGESVDFFINGDTTTAGYIVGEVVLDHCQALSADPMNAPGNFGGTGMVVQASGVQYRKLTIRNLAIGLGTSSPEKGAASASPLLINTDGNVIELVTLRSLLAGAVYDIDGITLRLTGTRSYQGGAANTWRFVRAEGADFHCDLDRLHVDLAGLTGVSAGATSDAFRWFDVAPGNASTGRIQASRIRAVSTPTGGSHNVVLLNTLLTLVGRAQISRCDLAKLPGNGSDYNIGNATLQAATVVKAIVSARVARARTAITVGASPFTYQNLDVMEEDVLVLGGTVNNIFYSINGSVFDAIVSPGTTNAKIRVAPGDYVQVNYSVAPTMQKLLPVP